MKHFVITGCSFTASSTGSSWSNHFDEFLKSKYNDNYQLHNVAISAIGNDLISFNCIKVIQSLLDNEVDYNDIKVIIQWSGLNRQSKYVKSSVDVQMNVDFQEINNKHYNIRNDSNYKFINPAGKYKFNGYWGLYFEKFFHTSEAFRNTLDNILKIQWYLKSVNIKYKMFTAWDIFTTTDLKNENILDRLFGNGDKVNQFSDKVYSNKKNKLYKEEFLQISHMWDMIDWSNFWTFKNSKVKFGGMMQWIQTNVFRKRWYVSREDKHPSSVSAKQFMESVICPIIEEWS